MTRLADVSTAEPGISSRRPHRSQESVGLPVCLSLYPSACPLEPASKAERTKTVTIMPEVATILPESA